MLGLIWERRGIIIHSVTSGSSPAKHNNRKTEDMKMKLAFLFAQRSGLKLKQVVLRLCAGLRGRKSTSPSCVINKTREKKSIMQCLEFKKEWHIKKEFSLVFTAPFLHVFNAAAAIMTVFSTFCSWATFTLRRDVSIMSVYVRGGICLQSWCVFPRLLSANPRWSRRILKCAAVNKPFLESEWVKLQLAAAAFICQRDHAACSGIPRRLSRLIRLSPAPLCLRPHWLVQTNPLYALLQSWFRWVI